ncbi:unnamed protein product [Lactuca saligna]|uniref:1,3-beta-glucan synthase component FKS1-like domain-containing protein n=1 Tax=Lactuca saligna TaxID=75948 RepID=A0AA36E9G0_LACSI|nr:unnamed protein product [Lactuca saligna]
MALHSLVLNPEDTTTTTTITKPMEELSTMVKPDQALYPITLKFEEVVYKVKIEVNPADLFLDLANAKSEGIALDSMHDYEQGENTDDEKNSIRQQLITCYETRLKTDEARRNQGGKAIHASWTNYDDLNEYFCQEMSRSRFSVELDAANEKIISFTVDTLKRQLHFEPTAYGCCDRDDPDVPCNDDIFLLFHPSTPFPPCIGQVATTDSMCPLSPSSHVKVEQGIITV